MITLAVFFGIGIAVIVPFIIVYGDSMPQADDGRALGARRAIGEDPVVLIVVVGTAVVAGTAAELVFRRLRPRFARLETTRDVAAAARAVSQVGGSGGESGNHLRERAQQVATSYLLGLDKRQWPYEADRVWAYIDTGDVEVVAERSFQKPGLLWHWGDRHRATRMDVRGRARVRTDGTEASEAFIVEPHV
ncbi:hypothetical protein EF847_08055 [Actinobacteria bacterium YIM 96077]|uniref:Uncharacterized protein n=1 Tax=Phytoactinopolyspora halophila TaxID=1981511 RepID=A0A329QDR7_9ACTN|nr:hypothetical protein EF847_08055 [Actinobacteria bacterium YIM 96077]RAW10585.1 hypothetical protein DPM12_18760 [Phytoactinopolyspora halophila]